MVYYSPALKKWGLYWIWVVCQSVCHSVIILSLLHISWENKLIEFYKRCISIHLDQIWVGIVTHHFSHIWNRVDVRISFPLNIKKKLEFHLVYALILTRSRLGFPTFVPEVWPFINTKNLFQLTILRIDRISPKYALILTTSRLGMLHMTWFFAHLYRSYGCWPIIGVSDKARLKPVTSYTESS